MPSDKADLGLNDRNHLPSIDNSKRKAIQYIPLDESSEPDQVNMDIDNQEDKE